MATQTSTTKTVFGKLIQPLMSMVDQCNYKRKCKTLPDPEWIKTGLLRILTQEPSGRAFLQKLSDSGVTDLKRSHFFETLKSKRRLKLCRDVGLSLYAKMRTNNTNNPFAQFTELEGYDIHAGDGHYHKSAVHDVRKDGRKHPTQHFYSIDLRNHALRHLTLADTSGTRKREYDTRALKRLEIETLRQSAPKGKKVIYVWDRAGIDFFQWFKWKHLGGIYFISREKKNMAPMVIGEMYYDKKDPINKGVQEFQIIGCAAGVMMHRVVYKCPISGDTFNFVTSLRTIPPGLIAYLYRTRWDIEKTFDDIKNKLSEKKAWATSDIAKEMQAQFVCMAYNLMLLLEGCIEKEGIINDIEDIRRSKRLKEVLANTKISKKTLPAFLTQPKRATQRSVKFIRWIRNHLFMNTSWREALGPLQRIYAAF
ncbi:MAG TPA: transposase [Ignavibacteriaceae bacterium]|nr:transposase [Ignavibacteriaceae bacterium]